MSKLGTHKSLLPSPCKVSQILKHTSMKPRYDSARFALCGNAYPTTSTIKIDNTIKSIIKLGAFLAMLRIAPRHPKLKIWQFFQNFRIYRLQSKSLLIQQPMKISPYIQNINSNTTKTAPSVTDTSDFSNKTSTNSSSPSTLTG